MPSVPERYRKYAAECLRIAQAARDEDDKARLLAMAQAWHRLAENIEKSDDPRN
jgi:hypothetical protein